MATILVADDHKNTCVTLEAILQSEGHSVTTVQSGRAAIEQIHEKVFDIIVTDLRLGDMDGINVLSAVRQSSPNSKVVLMTAFGTINSTVKAMKLGAYDYLTKPIQRSKILSVVNEILSESNRDEARFIGRIRTPDDEGKPEIIGEHPSIIEVIKMIDEVTKVDVPVLILGESGTGKELVAKSIHRLSQRSKKPYVALNCATLPENLQDSELFGHVKGAFTGAVERKAGLFEQADGGTILLDEIGEMNLGTQAKLLRVLEDGEIRPLGGSTVCHVDTRVLASTNEDLQALIKAERFREDLFFRLNVIRIILPPLRERSSDLPLLVEYFIKKFVDRYHKEVKGISREAMIDLEGHRWPGNVREMENTIKRAVILCKSTTISASDLGPLRENQVDEITPRPMSEMEKSLILKTLEETNWDKNLTASRLGISPTTLWRKIKKFGLSNPNV